MITRPRDPDHEPHQKDGAIDSGDSNRFAFGKNWSRFLAHVDDERIAASERGLTEMLGTDALVGKAFLDIGSGSGLSSLAARRLGATVHSFDYDPESVASTNELRRRYFPNDDGWTIQQGSVLDQEFMRSLGQFDVVYSWGVLHHTGDLWTALSHAADTVRPGGKFFVAIYNDNGLASRMWRAEKRLYVAAPRVVRALLVAGVAAMMESRQALASAVRGLNPLPFKRWRDKKTQRGMSAWHDLIDWVGGYPFEFAKPGEVFTFLRARGFVLEAMTTYTGSGPNNQYVFQRPSAGASRSATASKARR